MAASPRTLLDFLPTWFDQLQQWSLSGRLNAAAKEALLLNGQPQELQDLVSQWSSGDFQAVPEIVLLSNADINGALGAYAQSTGKIYLNADWFATATQEAVNAVLTEELGHHLDGLLNAVDTVGDEGEYFSDLLRGVVLRDTKEAFLRAEGDSGIIQVEGKPLRVEYSLQPTSIQPIVQFSKVGDNFAGRCSSDGTYVYLATTTAGVTSLSKYDLNGTPAWEKNLDQGGAGPCSSAIADDGSILIASGSDGLSGKSSTLARFSSTGEKIWEVANSNQRYGWDIAINGDTVYVSGGTGTGFNNSNTAFINAYSLNTGSVLWSKAYPNSGASFIGDLEISNGKIYCAAALYGKVDFDTAIAGCIDLNGNEVWWKTAPAPDWNALWAVRVVGNQLIGTGYKADGGDRGDTRLMSFSTSDGAILWDTSWGDNNQQGSGSIEEFNGKIYVAYGDGVPWNSSAISGGYSAVAELDTSGNLLNTYTYNVPNSYDGAGGLVKAGNSLFLLGQTTGAISGQTNGGGYDIYLASVIKDINGNPTDITTSSSTFNENIAPSTAVATFSTADPDAGDTFTYSLVLGTGSTDNGTFTISGDTLLINSSPNYEAKSSYSIRVRTTDAGGLYTEKAITLGVNDVNEAIRGNSFYTIVKGPSWENAETDALTIGGHLVAIGSSGENNFLVNTFGNTNLSYFGGAADEDVYWIGLTKSSGAWKWSDGTLPTYLNWGPKEPYENSGTADRSEITLEAYLNPDSLFWTNTAGNWNNNSDILNPLGRYGIAEIPLTLSITRQGEVKEGSGLFTTSINLSAGTQASGNLADGVQVWWKVTGITADDLALNSDALTGSGIITNGKLDIQHSLKVDSDSGENFEISVYSDASMTSEYQIGTTSSAAVQESTLYVRGNSIYRIVEGNSWTESEDKALAIGGHLAIIQDAAENQYLASLYRNYGLSVLGITNEYQPSAEKENPYIGVSDSAVEGVWRYADGTLATYTNWGPGVTQKIESSEDYGVMGVFFSEYDPTYDSIRGIWDDKPNSGGGGQSIWYQHGIAESTFVRRGDSAYVIVQGPTWEAAEANAVALGGHLVTINDSNEYLWFQETFGNRRYLYSDSPDGTNGVTHFWIGLNDLNRDGIKDWISGESSSVTLSPDMWRGSVVIDGRGSSDYPDADYGVWLDYTVWIGSDLGSKVSGWGLYSQQWLTWYGSGQTQAGIGGSNIRGVAEIQLAPNIEHTGTPTLTGTFKAGQTISIDASAIQDGDNFAGYTPTYSYSWEVSTDNGGTWAPITTSDATDGNNTYTLTAGDVGKQIRGVVRYLDGHGTYEVIATDQSTFITYPAVNYALDNNLIITAPGAGTIDAIPFSNTYTIDLALGADTATLTSAAGLNTQMTVEGGAGNDTLNGNENNNVLILTGENQGTLDGLSFSGFENVNLGAGNDIVYILPGGSLTGLLNGGGTKKIVYLPPGVPVPPPGGVIPPPTTPPTTPPIALPPPPPGFDIDGGYNAIYLNDNANSITLTGAGSGIVDGTNFTNFYSVDLRGGADIATINAGGSLAGLLDGGAGTDTLTLNSGVNALSINSALSGTAAGTTIAGFESINLADGNDTAEFIFNDISTQVVAPRQSLTIDGGFGTDSLVLNLTPSEVAYLKVQGTFSALKSFLANPTGQSLTVELSSVDLTLTGFENGRFANNEPYGINLTPSAVDENLPTSSVAATLTTSDPDLNDTFTYSFATGTGDTDNGSFTFLGNQLFFQASPNYEVKSSYTIRLQTTDAGGLSFQQSVTLNINNLQEGPGNAGPITSATPTVFTEGVTLSAGSISGDPDGNGTITAYQWYFNDGVISGETSATYKTSAIGFGTYKVSLTYTDGKGDPTTIFSANQVVTKIDNGQGNLSDITASGALTEGVILTAGTISGDPDGNGTPASYQWLRNGTAIGGATSASYLVPPAGAGTYTVQVSYRDGQDYLTTLTSTGTVVTAPPPATDLTPPTISSISTQGTTVILKFSEAIAALPVSTTAFAVSTLDSKNKATTRTISTVARDLNDPTKLILTLTGTASASNVNLRVSYTDPVGTQSTGDVQDLAGNDLASFSNRYADTFITSSTTTLASQYLNLLLTGTTAINGTGNANNNIITGNSAKNFLVGGAGADTLTGLAGADTFRYSLADSRLAAFDRITDFTIGTDILDGPTAVSAANLKDNVGTINGGALTAAAIQSVLTTTTFVRNGASTFTWVDGTTTRTFLALNDATAGFQAANDGLIEITGVDRALLGNLAVV